MSSRSTPPPRDALVGTSFGSYYIEALIGVGGMGRVYAGKTRDGERVAVKVIRGNYARDETFRRRFRREVRIAQTVQNPHVVPVLDSGEQSGLPYLVAKLIDGVSLQQKIEREGRLDLHTTVRICAQVADGLRALSDAGMVHRDVKPGNILLDREERAYLTDFGLAKDSQGSVLTRPGQTLGSMDYMAPEQIRGQPVTAAADIYALGCVTFECLTGHAPFADRQGMRVLWAHLQEEPPDPRTERADIPREVTTVLNAALQKEPNERPRTSVEYSRLLSLAARIRVKRASDSTLVIDRSRPR